MITLYCFRGTLYVLHGMQEKRHSSTGESNLLKKHIVISKVKNQWILVFHGDVYSNGKEVKKEELCRYTMHQDIENITLEDNLAGSTDADKISSYAVQATRAQMTAMLQRFCELLGNT